MTPSEQMRVDDDDYYWQRRDRSGVGYSYSQTLLDIAGGVDRLIREWEQVSWSEPIRVRRWETAK